MKKVKFLFVAVALLLSCATMQAQFGKRLGKAVENAAKKTAERKAEQKTEEAVGKAIDKATDPDTYRDKDGGKESNSDAKSSKSQKPSQNNSDSEIEAKTDGEPAAATPQQGVKAAEMAYAKSDFVPGDEIMFEDDQASEQMGEFPSMWDLLQGNAEIAGIDGQNVIYMDKSTVIAPLMKNPKQYLSESYTVEFDFYVRKDIGGWWKIELMDKDGGRKSNIELWSAPDANRTVEGSWTTTTGENRNSDSKADLSAEGWHHCAISFNKRALKVYFDGLRTMNVPNVAQAEWCRFSCTGKHYLRNVRIAKGAVPLYDRMMTDGKIVTYGITFDVGKSTIKPESMGEINRIAKLMTDNPDLKFSVEGHTDSTGSEAANRKLSDERSAAVVTKLIETGISKDRLQPAGKGQTSPVADNATDEGRAKNRRVEFVKI
ncbi:MAG: OmpA family protein [Tannerella sp.]|jgi:outer membrane protein OmpA-like peptidoglycan-associated protein|nr:OmpA family protein [Tannerella sp.]